MKINQLITSILLVCISSAVFSQSISGNAKSEFSTMNLSYANVNIYKDGKLVANVLTNDKGDFKVKLDTGYYKCEIIFAGHEKITKNVHVTKDEKTDFSLKEDVKSIYAPSNLAKAKITEGTIRSGVKGAPTSVSEDSEIVEDHAFMMVEEPAKFMGGEPSYEKTAPPPPTKIRDVVESKSASASIMWGTDTSKKELAQYGKLTAGEINDFSKWSLWNDLTKGELQGMQTLWNFSPTSRYSIQINDQQGLPLANAKVELLSNNLLLYTAISDNTGKAELWETLKYDSSFKRSNTPSLRVTYNNVSQTIDNAKNIDKGINSCTFTTECNQLENVDIAFVVDATGSMQDEIDYLKSDLNRVIFKSKEISTTLNIQFANIFYRDHGDAYITQTQDFTSVLSESIAYTNLHNADGGGDGPEAVEIALDSAINNLKWRENTRTKIMFLVLDASPHNTPEIQNKLRELSAKAAAKGIRIVPIAGSGIGKDTEYLMRCIALATNGTYTFLTDHSGIGNSHIKPSTDSYTVEILNDLLVRVLKSYTYMPTCTQEIINMDINLPDSVVTIQNEIDSTTIDTLDTTTQTPEISWKYYPNPTSGIIHIEANVDIPELYISDLSGKAIQIIRDIQANTIVTTDISMFPAGIYLIRYPIGKQWISGKIILKR